MLAVRQCARWASNVVHSQAFPTEGNHGNKGNIFCNLEADTVTASRWLLKWGTFYDNRGSPFGYWQKNTFWLMVLLDGNLQRSRCCTRKKIGWSVNTIVASSSWHTPAEYSAKSPRVASGCVLTSFGRVGTVGMERGYSWSFVPFQSVFRCLCPFQLQKEKAGIAANSTRQVTFWTVNIKHSVQL